MKLSRYTFVFQVGDDRFLAYNALTNGLALIEPEVAELLQHFSLQKFLALDPELQRELRRGGFVVPEGLDEVDVVRMRFRAAQYQGGWVGLTVAPTLACNLACRYCFESSCTGFMTEETQEALVQFTSRLLPDKGGRLEVVWYGGEPLLAMETIADLTARFKVLCSEKQAHYHASIITNGTLLTGEVARRLRELDVASAQVTLDGPPEVHDRRRPYRSGGGSFNRILENLRHAVPELPISLRINVDRHNAHEAFSFAQWLVRQAWFDPQRVTVHFGYVRKYTPSCGCGLDEMLKPQEFFELSGGLADALSEQGLFAPPYPDLALGCTATSTSSYVVGPEGELYRCWNHVGDKRMVVGSVFEEPFPHPLFLRYLLAGFEDDPECLQCRFLPLCGGGCVDIRLKASQGLLPGKDCASWRYSLERRLAAYYRWWWAHRQQAEARDET